MGGVTHLKGTCQAKKLPLTIKRPDASVGSSLVSCIEFKRAAKSGLFQFPWGQVLFLAFEHKTLGSSLVPCKIHYAMHKTCPWGQVLFLALIILQSVVSSVMSGLHIIHV